MVHPNDEREEPPVGLVLRPFQKFFETQANGAGKTTLMRTISGLLRPARGHIRFRDAAVEGLPAERLVTLGLSLCPEGRQLFPQLPVGKNLRPGAYTRRDEDGIKATIEQVYELFPILVERRNQLAGTLSGGEQQMLAIGRALMSKPRLLLLDEPSLGLAPLLVERIFEAIGEINQTGTTIFLVEQNAAMALSIATRGYVLEAGRIVLADSAAALAANDRVREAYLGA